MATATITAVEKMPQGHVKITVDIETNGFHRDWFLMCQWHNFIEKTDAEIDEWIQKNIEYQLNNVVMEKFKETYHDALITDKLNSRIGNTYSKNTAIFEITTKLGAEKPDKEITLKEDGTYISKATASVAEGDI